MTKKGHQKFWRMKTEHFLKMSMDAPDG